MPEKIPGWITEMGGWGVVLLPPPPPPQEARRRATMATDAVLRFT